MADVPVPSIVTATPDGDDTVLGVKDGVVKRFTLDNVGAGINFSNINATTNMAFNTASVERMRIDSAGNVGIGYATPEYKLDVNGEVRFFGTDGAGTGGAFRVFNTSAGATNPFKHFRVNSTGSWQIVNSAYSAITHQFDDNGSFVSLGGVNAPAFYDKDNTAYYLDPANTGTSMAVAGNVGIGITVPVNNTGYGGLSINGPSGAVISMMQSNSETFRITNATGYSFINTTGATPLLFGTGASERMRITDAGNVGIGTTSPGARLDVNGNARLSNGGAFVSANSLIRQIESVSGAENQFTVGSIGFLTGSFSDNGQISFSTNAGSGNTERMRLDSAGNLAMTGGGVVDAASFRDYSNTAYYLDPANTGTSLNVAGSVIQGVNTTAPTLSANNTLTFSIVDNSTLRVSVRGSDGVTRTATIALT